MASEIGEEEWLHVRKRSRLAAPPFNQQPSNNHVFSLIPPNNNPVDGPGPLGLSLRKTPSLLELLQAMLSKSQVNSPSPSPPDDSGSKKDIIKASRFAASVLKIGNWEYVSRYEGDLVVKCYFGKHQLVWEVVDHGSGDGVKSKMEIQWSDITGLKADCLRGVLTLTLARKPAFFRETDPQPRKHTAWRPTTDFTGGQATVHMQHYVECSPGVLNMHCEKLIQCDTRLAILSRKPAEILSVGCDDDDRPLMPTSDEDRNSSLPSVANDDDDDDMLESMSRILLSDTDHGTDETSLMRKVNSLGCCLVQEEDDIGFDLVNDYMNMELQEPMMMPRQDSLGDLLHDLPHIALPPKFDDIGFDLINYSTNENIIEQQEPTVPRQDSFEDMLLNLPRIASLPKFDDIGFDLVSDSTNYENMTEQGEPMMPRQDSFGDLLHALSHIASPPKFDDIGFDLMNDSSNDNIMEQQEPMMPRQDSFGDLLHNLPPFASPPKFL